MLLLFCKEITCPELLHPTRGTVKYYKVFPRSIAVYQCIFGYKTLGENSRMCGDDGQWKGYEPTCKTMESYVYCMLNIYLLKNFTMHGM